MLLNDVREEVCRLHAELPRHNLVAWTSGNVSGRDPQTGFVVIKPSGIRYEELTPEDMVVVDLDGKVVEGKHKPSSDTFAHVYVYRHRPDVNGVVHTHSTFATAWAAAGRPIPPVLTAICDEFGGPIPVGAYAKIGGDEIGQEIVRSIGNSPAILMKNHGVFTDRENTRGSRQGCRDGRGRGPHGLLCPAARPARRDPCRRSRPRSPPLPGRVRATPLMKVACEND